MKYFAPQSASGPMDFGVTLPASAEFVVLHLDSAP